MRRPSGKRPARLASSRFIKGDAHASFAPGAPSHPAGRLVARGSAGANDGIVSTASLVLGVAAANASQQSVLIAGMAGLVAGAMSMAAGEYVSVHSQADAEQADIDRERQELKTDNASEHRELASIYQSRG